MEAKKNSPGDCNGLLSLPYTWKLGRSRGNGPSDLILV